MQLPTQHRELANQIKKKWLANFLNTSPSDRPKAEEAVREIYEINGFPPPKEITWVLSPKEAVTYISKKYLGEEIPTKETIFDIFSMMCYGNEDVIWLASYDFYSRFQPFFSSLMEPLIKLAESTHSWFPLRDEAVMLERERTVTWDSLGKASSRTSPSITFKDGFKINSLEGFRVPEHVIHNPQSITVEEVRQIRNTELRRIYLQQLGHGEYLRKCNAELVDADVSTIPGGAPRALVRDQDGFQWLVLTDSSTTRVYFIDVDPDAETVIEALESISGLPQHILIAES